MRGSLVLTGTSYAVAEISLAHSFSTSFPPSFVRYQAVPQSEGNFENNGLLASCECPSNKSQLPWSEYASRASMRVSPESWEPMGGTLRLVLFRIDEMARQLGANNRVFGDQPIRVTWISHTTSAGKLQLDSISAA